MDGKLRISNIQPYVLYLPKAFSRLEKFRASWKAAREDYGRSDEELRYIVEVPGMDSEKFPRSPNWRQGNSPLDRRGHTACFWGHETMWRLALAMSVEQGLADTDAALFCEDDARFDVDFWTRVEASVKELPDDWDILYVGGQHLTDGRPAPSVYSDNLFKVVNVNRTHSYIIKISTLPNLLLHFSEHTDWGHRFTGTPSGGYEAEVDYEIGHLTETGVLNGYALRNPNDPKRNWATSQDEGFSWTQGKNETLRRWELTQ